MITLYGEGRGLRVAWLLEEMGLPWRLRPVDLMAGAQNDPEFIAVNPAGFIPALVDGETTIVESIAIMEYLLARYGPGPLAPAPHDPAFAPYQQFLHLGEAGLAMPIFFSFFTSRFAPEAERDSWAAREMRDSFAGRLALVTRQLERTPWLAGERFTAADISVCWTLLFARHAAGYELGPAESAYVARATDRDGFRRAVATCTALRDAWGLG